jgi:hypothetical protein
MLKSALKAESRNGTGTRRARRGEGRWEIEDGRWKIGTGGKHEYEI